MQFNKEQIQAMTAKERIELAEELWSSVEQELMPVTKDDVKFAEERLKIHQANPSETVTLTQLKDYFRDKYGI